MCYKFARLFNEGLLLPPRSEYFRPPPPMGVDIVLVPALSRLVEDNVIFVVPPHAEYVEGLDLLQSVEDVLPPANPEPLFVESGVATYGSRGRAYRGPVPPSAFASPRARNRQSIAGARCPELVERVLYRFYCRIFVCPIAYASINSFILFTCMRKVFLSFFTEVIYFRVFLDYFIWSCP